MLYFVFTIQYGNDENFEAKTSGYRILDNKSVVCTAAATRAAAAAVAPSSPTSLFRCDKRSSTGLEQRAACITTYAAPEPPPVFSQSSRGANELNYEEKKTFFLSLWDHLVRTDYSVTSPLLLLLLTVCPLWQAFVQTPGNPLNHLKQQGGCPASLLARTFF